MDAGLTWIVGEGQAFALEEGVYAAGSIQARQIDGAGNLGTAITLNSNEDIVVDKTPPSSITLTLVGGMVTVTHEDAENPTEAGVNIKMFTNGTLIGETTADEDGNWNMELNRELSQGESVQVVITDVAGNYVSEDETVI